MLKNIISQDFMDYWKNKRKEILEPGLNSLYETWLKEEIAAGRIKAPGWQKPVLQIEWLDNKPLKKHMGSWIND